MGSNFRRCRRGAVKRSRRQAYLAEMHRHIIRGGQPCGVRDGERALRREDEIRGVLGHVAARVNTIDAIPIGGAARQQRRSGGAADGAARMKVHHLDGPLALGEGVNMRRVRRAAGVAHISPADVVSLRSRRRPRRLLVIVKAGRRQQCGPSAALVQLQTVHETSAQTTHPG